MEPVRRGVSPITSLRINNHSPWGYLFLDFPLLPMQAETASALAEN